MFKIFQKLSNDNKIHQKGSKLNNLIPEIKSLIIVVQSLAIEFTEKFSTFLDKKCFNKI